MLHCNRFAKKQHSFVDGVGRICRLCPAPFIATNPFASLSPEVRGASDLDGRFAPRLLAARVVEELPRTARFVRGGVGESGAFALRRSPAGKLAGIDRIGRVVWKITQRPLAVDAGNTCFRRTRQARPFGWFAPSVELVR